MKLFTEEQVKHAIQMARASQNLFTTPFIYDKYEILEQLTPIKLPSDEEIEAELQNSMLRFEHEKGSIYSKAFTEFFNKGAKWMRDKIQGGKK